jgi:hypothetical protein
MSGSLSLFVEHCYTLYVLLTHTVIIELTRRQERGFGIGKGLERERLEKEVVIGLFFV